jgi:predicted O-methyltransferase YrrM
MNTLFIEPLASLLDALFKEADAIWASKATHFQSTFTNEERERLMRSKTDYRKFYDQLKDLPLAVSQETGLMLYMLTRSSNAKTIIEFGTSFGISTLHLAAAIRDNGGGLLITTEFEPSKVKKARENLIAGGLIDLVDIREGDALQTLSTNIPQTIDLLLLDGAKALYPEILNLVENRLKSGALIIADDVEYSPDYLSRVRSRENGYMSVPLNNGIELSMRLG